MKQYNEIDLIRIAKRRNNAKRGYLLVNPLQAKHLAVTPSKAAELMRALGELLHEKHFDEKLLVIGFAETATAISAYAAGELDCTYIQTTRESMSDCNEYFYFSEEHSHATEQKLCSDGLSEALVDVDRIIFIDDEISTGKTIINIVSLMRKSLLPDGMKITAASLINRMSVKDLQRFYDNGIETECLLKIPNESYDDVISEVNEDESLITDCRREDAKGYNCIELVYPINSRKICGIGKYTEAVDRALDGFIKAFSSDANVLAVIGTEECMYPAVRLGERLEQLYPNVDIKSFSTTRSPIAVSDSENYPMKNCAVLDSFYETGRTTFLYNISDYDEIIVVTDSESNVENAVNSIKNAFPSCDRLTVIRLKKEL